MTTTFPTLTGADWNIKKKIVWSVSTETSASGAEYRLGRWGSLPHYEFTMKINFMSQTDRDAVEAFIIGQQGSVIPFLLSIPNDKAKTLVSAGIGNSATSQFQIPLPPQAQVTGVSVLTVNGVVCVSGIPAPATPTLGQTAGGTKAARTYFVRVAYRNSAGGESPASSEATLAVGLNNLLTITAPASPPAGAVDWRVYVGTVTNVDYLQATLPLGTAYTESTSALATSTLYSATDRSTFSISPSGLIAFTFAPLTGFNIQWTGAYAYLVRFKDDIEINQFMSAMYEISTLHFRTVR